MSKQIKVVRLEELPDILTAQHIADYLSLSRATIYTLFQRMPSMGGIPNFEIGESSKRVDKPDFIQWLEARKREKGRTLERAT